MGLNRFTKYTFYIYFICNTICTSGSWHSDQFEYPSPHSLSTDPSRLMIESYVSGSRYYEVEAGELEVNKWHAIIVQQILKEKIHMYQIFINGELIRNEIFSLSS